MNHKFHFFQICSQFFFHWFDTRPYKQIVFRLSAFNKDYNDIVCGLWSAREQMQHGNYLLSTIHNLKYVGRSNSTHFAFVQGVCFMNERQSNSQEHEDCSGWQQRNTRLQWLMWPSTQRTERITEQVLSSLKKADDIISEACFTAMTHHHDELAAMDHSINIVALTSLMSINFKQ